MKLRGYAGRKPRGTGDKKGPGKHAVWPGLFINEAAVKIVNGSIQKR